MIVILAEGAPESKVNTLGIKQSSFMYSRTMLFFDGIKPFFESRVSSSVARLVSRHMFINQFEFVCESLSVVFSAENNTST